MNRSKSSKISSGFFRILQPPSLDYPAKREESLEKKVSELDSINPQLKKENYSNNESLPYPIINRPGVAGAVLQTPLSLIH